MYAKTLMHIRLGSRVPLQTFLLVWASLVAPSIARSQTLLNRSIVCLGQFRMRSYFLRNFVNSVWPMSFGDRLCLRLVSRSETFELSVMVLAFTGRLQSRRHWARGGAMLCTRSACGVIASNLRRRQPTGHSSARQMSALPFQKGSCVEFLDSAASARLL